MFEKLTSALPIGGGTTGAVLGTMTFHEIADQAVTASVFAVVGTIIGYVVKLGLDKLKEICKK